tara:strand:- start:5129 stop:5512 length:384 start_codon:yes stop_codon:yes gene_type:complete
MKLILNDIKYLSLKDINFYKDRIYYHINNIRINGLYFKINKNMIETDNKYKVYLTKDIISLNEYISEKYKSFIKDNDNPYIEVVKNNITDKIYNDNETYLILNFMSINDNNYPKIHILQCQQVDQEI